MRFRPRRRPWTVYTCLAILGVGSIALATGLMLSLREAIRPGPVVPNGPITVWLTSDREWDTPEGRALIRHLSRGLGYLDNVTEVRSLTQPLGRPLPDSAADAAGLFAVLEWQGTDDGFVNPRRLGREQFLISDANRPGWKTIARIDVALNASPYECAETLAAIESLLGAIVRPENGYPVGLRCELSGPAVQVNEANLAAANGSRRSLSLAAGGLCLIVLAGALRELTRREQPNRLPVILRMPLPVRFKAA
jgi:hypothetical protein